MREELIAGSRIEVRGFGVLETRDTEPKPSARYPRTGEIVYVPARRKTHFRAGQALKEGMCQPLPERDWTSESQIIETGTQEGPPWIQNSFWWKACQDPKLASLSGG